MEGAFVEDDFLFRAGVEGEAGAGEVVAECGCGVEPGGVARAAGGAAELGWVEGLEEEGAAGGDPGGGPAVERRAGLGREVGVDEGDAGEGGEGRGEGEGVGDRGARRDAGGGGAGEEPFGGDRAAVEGFDVPAG